MMTEVTFKHLASICATLEQILEPGFGPNALSTMFSTTTGKMMVASDSWSILNSLTLAHPLGKIILESVKNYVNTYGDGGKAYILIVAQIFKEFEQKHASLSTPCERHDIICGLYKMRKQLPRILEGLSSHLTVINAGLSSHAILRDECQKMIRIHLQGSFPCVTADHLTNILLTMLFDGLSGADSLSDIVLDVITNFDTCYIEAVGHTPCSSQVIQGFVIQRDYLTVSPTLSARTNVKFVLVNCSLQGEDSDTDTAYRVSDGQAMIAALSHKGRITSRVVDRLKRDGVCLIISGVKVVEAVSLACHAAGISVVHMVEEEEIDRLAILFDVLPINSVQEFLIETEHEYGVVSKCGYVILSGQKYVHLIPESSTVFRTSSRGVHVMKQMLLTGHSRGVCCQLRTVLKNCLKSLHMWLISDIKQVISEEEMCSVLCSCPAASIASGAVFETFVYNQLQNEHTLSKDPQLVLVCSIMARSLLQIPLTILKKSYIPNAKRLTLFDIVHKLKDCGAVQINGKSGEILSVFDHSHLEPVYAKVAMLYHIIDLVTQILRIDQLVPVHKLPEGT